MLLIMAEPAVRKHHRSDFIHINYIQMKQIKGDTESLFI